MEENLIENQKKEIESAYKTAIAARNFHLDHFNKWMTYYYVAVAAIFVAFYNLKDIDNSNIVYGLLILGFLVSVLWHLSCKGYYFWTKNWLDIVLKFEKQLPQEQVVYSLFSNRIKVSQDNLFSPFQSANISTSKVTLLLSYLACFIWVFILTDKLLSLIYCVEFYFCFKFILALTINIVTIYGLGKLLKSDISMHKLFDNQ